MIRGTRARALVVYLDSTRFKQLIGFDVRNPCVHVHRHMEKIKQNKTKPPLQLKLVALRPLLLLCYWGGGGGGGGGEVKE